MIAPSDSVFRCLSTESINEAVPIFVRIGNVSGTLAVAISIVIAVHFTKTNHSHLAEPTVVKANLRQKHQKNGTGKDAFSGLFSSFPRSTCKIFREVVGKAGGALDGTSPKVCVYYGNSASLHAAGPSVRSMRLSTKSIGLGVAPLDAEAIRNVSTPLTVADISDVIAGRFSELCSSSLPRCGTAVYMR
jgi:hypothetical protein